MDEPSVNPEPGREPARSPVEAGPAVRRVGLFAALRTNLVAGCRLLIPWRVAPAHFVPTFDQALCLLILSLLVWAGMDRLHADSGASLQLDGLFGWAAYLMTGLSAAALVARAQDSGADTRALLVPVLAAAPFLLLTLWLLSDLPFVRGRPLPAVAVALAYFELIGLRALRAAYGRPRLRAALLAAALILAAPFVLDSFGLDTRLWLVDEPDQAQDEDVSTAESLLYDQPARIAAAVERVAPAVPEKAHLFFVGFAGVGEQAVFKREVLYAQQVFAKRFGTGERSVELINDIRDRDSYPLATVSGLDQAIRLLADRMDPEEDVLVLMLSSHGSEDGLEVSNGGLRLAQLGPADLQEILDDSRIKWRIIIVSACYSGVFLDELKSDSTLIITAADSEHSSFGCDDSGELTWFGEAFLRDSLPGADSLEAAFRNAAALIRQRETAEHQIHSNPQLFMGPLMRAKLAGLQPGSLSAPERTEPGSGTRIASVQSAHGHGP